MEPVAHTARLPVVLSPREGEMKHHCRFASFNHAGVLRITGVMSEGREFHPWILPVLQRKTVSACPLRSPG